MNQIASDWFNCLLLLSLFGHLFRHNNCLIIFVYTHDMDSQQQRLYVVAYVSVHIKAQPSPQDLIYETCTVLIVLFSCNINFHWVQNCVIYANQRNCVKFV